MAGVIPARLLEIRHNGLPSGDEFTPDMVAQINWNDKSTRTSLVLAVNIACISLIVLFVTARLLVRRFMTRQFFADDALVTVAAVFTVGLCIVCMLALSVGFGQHVWNMNLATVYSDISKCVRLMFIGNIFYVCAITFTKLSIIASYLRIFPYRSLRIAMYITTAVTVGLFIASVPATIFQCVPVSAAWDTTSEQAGAKCFTFINFLYASTAINVTTDLALCTAPLPFFWKLQLPRKQKIIVSCLFIIGGFACVASIIRLSFLHLLSNALDVTWNLAPSVLWTIAECTIGICCVSVPPMRPLFGRLLPDIFVTRRVQTGTAGATQRREAYAMGGWESREAKSSTPSPAAGDVEKGSSSNTSTNGAGGGGAGGGSKHFQVTTTRFEAAPAESVTGEEEQTPRSFLERGDSAFSTDVTVLHPERSGRTLQKG